jgi:hypothetical protein
LIFSEYSKTLEADIKDDTSGGFRKIMVSLVQANRDESTNVNQAQARTDAQELYNAGICCNIYLIIKQYLLIILCNTY